MTTPEQTRAIAKEAYIYGFPMVDSYRIQHAYFVDEKNPEYKGDWNRVHSMARVFTPADKAVQTPNSDTPYSMLGADLRAEPLVLTVPPIEPDRYYSLQFVDAYTYNFAYVGSRTTGNGGGRYLLTGPGWAAEKPDGIDQVIASETELALVVYRTQLFGPTDLENVKTIQSGYGVRPLSAFLGKPAPQAPPIEFVAPLTPEEQRTSPRFFEVLNFLLRFAPTVPSEEQLRERLASIGIAADGGFDAASLKPGIADAWAQFQIVKTTKLDSGEVTSADLFGTRDKLGDNYLYRMAAAVLGIFGNSAEEAMYPFSGTDSSGAALTGEDNYTYRFAPGQPPPVNAFWSLTMYEMPASLLVDNPIDRYLINSPMLDGLIKDSDGGITLYIQHDSPGPDREPNWLPAPAGPFALALRLYWPKQEALDGRWQAPKPVKA